MLLLLLLLSCGGSGGGSVSPSSSSIFPQSVGKRVLYPSPEGIFNHIDDLSNNNIIVKGGDADTEERANLIERGKSFSTIIADFDILKLFYIEDGNIYFPNPTKEEGDDQDEFLSSNIITSNNTMTLSGNYSSGGNIIVFNLIVERLGIINNEPYYSISIVYKAPNGQKMYIKESGQPQTIDYDSPIKGVEEFGYKIPLKYSLREIDDNNVNDNEDIIKFNLSERAPFNKSESNFSLKRATFVESNGQMVDESDLGNGINIIFESVTKLIEDIIPNEIGNNNLNIEENNTFELPITRWDLGEDNIKLKRHYKGFIAYSKVSDPQTNIEIDDYQFVFNNTSFHNVKVIINNNKAIKINNGKFEYSTDDDAFTEINLLFTSDIEED